MTISDQFERDLPDLLEELGMGPAPDYRDLIVRQTAAMRQRPAWMFPERWLNVDIATRPLAVAPVNWRLLAVAGLLILAGIVVAIVATGSRQRLPAPPFGPAANGLIVYESAGDIYLGDPVTGTSGALTSGPRRDLDPRFSPDGTKIAFLRTSTERLGADLVIVNADGTDLRVVTSQPLRNVTSGDWSGDGRSMLVVAGPTGGQAISIVDIEAGTVRSIDVGIGVTSAAFRPPDASEIAFTGKNLDDSAVYVVSALGGEPRRLATGEGPLYSPDGSRIAYHVVRFEKGSPEVEWNGVRVMDADGGNDHGVGERRDVQFQGTARWSPDGSRILVFRAYYPTRYGHRLGLAVVPADGSGPGQDIDVSTPGGFGTIGWSPDGRSVVFTPAEPESDAALVTVETGQSRMVPNWYAGNWQRLAP